MDRTCDKNPQLPAHRHYRYDGSLWCEGYAPEFKNEKPAEKSKAEVLV